jgi:uncharacterized protein YcfL
MIIALLLGVLCFSQPTTQQHTQQSTEMNPEILPAGLDRCPT